MARKKTAAAATEATATAVPLEDQIKKLVERGKKRGALTYEEINTMFDNVEDVDPDRIDQLFEELAALNIEVVEEEKVEKPASEEGGTTSERFVARGPFARRSGPDVSQGDRPRPAAVDG